MARYSALVLTTGKAPMKLIRIGVMLVATFRFFERPIPHVFTEPSFLLGSGVMALILFILIRTPLANPGHPDEPAPPAAMM